IRIVPRERALFGPLASRDGCNTPGRARGGAVVAQCGRPRAASAVRRRFWDGIRVGLLIEEAAELAGVSGSAGRKWFRQRGGVAPRASTPAVKRPRLTFEQREEIAALRAERLSNAEIARRVGVHRSTIGRELAAGSTRFPDQRPKYRA